MIPLRAAIGILQLNIVSARVSLAISRDDRARNAPLSAPKLMASQALDLKIGSNHWRLRRRIGSLQSGKAPASREFAGNFTKIWPFGENLPVRTQQNQLVRG